MITTILSTVLVVCGYVLLAYCVMSFIMPNTPLFRTLASYVEPVLDPIRNLMFQFFPFLRRLPVDLSPIGACLILRLLSVVVRLLGRII